MTHPEEIKKNYDECKLSYEAALDLLEARGMSVGEADDYLVSSQSSQLRQSKGD